MPTTPDPTQAQRDHLDTLLAMTPLGRAILGEQTPLSRLHPSMPTPPTPPALAVFSTPVAFAGTLAVPSLTPAQRKVLESVLNALEAPHAAKEGMTITTLAHLLKLSQPDTIALVQKMKEDGALEFRRDRVHAHRASIAAQY